MIGHWATSCEDNGQLKYAKYVLDISAAGEFNLTEKLYDDMSCTGSAFEIGVEENFEYTFSEQDAGNEQHIAVSLFELTDESTYQMIIQYEIQGDILYFSHRLTIKSTSFTFDSDQSRDINYVDYLMKEEL